MTTLLIARHGNTFDAGDKIIRVGKKTDLPLSISGKDQAKLLGEYLRKSHPDINAAYSSTLTRTYETAKIALEILGVKTPVIKNAIFDEIDYGPDEGKTEEEVFSRIGKEAIEKWDSEAIVPSGWNINPKQIITNWKSFAVDISEKFPEGIVLIVTSNGIARFAPHLTGDFENFSRNYKIKISTGAICSLTGKGQSWHIDYWNIRP